MRVEISENGARELEALAYYVKKLFSDIENECMVLNNVVKNTEGLGVYEEKIKDLVLNVEHIINLNKNSVETIASAINDIAYDIRVLLNALGGAGGIGVMNVKNMGMSTKAGQGAVQTAANIIPDVAPLASTAQTIRVVKNEDGTISKVFDHPEKLAMALGCTQGNNNYGMLGTCGLASTAQWLKIMGSRYTENDVVGYAYNSNLCSSTGGTSIFDIVKIWDAFGISAQYMFKPKLSELADYIEEGRAVVVGVNAGKLWGMDNPEGYDCFLHYGDGGANHAISITSVMRDPVTDAIQGFYISDTGRGYDRDRCRFISLSDMEYALYVNRGSACISNKPMW